MGRSKIEWVSGGYTWNPIRARHKATGKVGWHCTHASPGCVHCYAESMNKWRGTGLAFKPGHESEIELFLDEDMLRAPLNWRGPNFVFPCSMTDIFGDFVRGEWLIKMFAVMACCPDLTFQVLTKRADAMHRFMTDQWTRELIGGEAIKYAKGQNLPERAKTVIALFKPYPLRNIWLGVSAEDQRRYEERVFYLRRTPAARRWLSLEPLLGPIDMLRDEPIDWVVCGGESGRDARPAHPNWFRSIRDQCAAADIPFTLKQWGEWIPGVVFGSNNDRRVPIGSAEHQDGLQHGGKQSYWWSGDAIAGGEISTRVGKKTSGRMLDGVIHDAKPEMVK